MIGQSGLETIAASPGVQRICEELVKADIRLVATLPDDWLAGLLKALAREPRIRVVHVPREEEAVGVCSGAYFSGINSAVLMGSAGFLQCGHVLSTLNLAYQIPLLMLLTRRGTFEEAKPYQVVQGLVTLDYADALTIPYTLVDEVEKIGVIPNALARARVTKRPVAVFFTKSVLVGQ